MGRNYRGRKTICGLNSTRNCCLWKKNNNTDIAGIDSGTFALTNIEKYTQDIILHPDGSITADRDGYYIWSISIKFFIKNSSNGNNANTSTHNYALGNIFPGNVTYAFKNGVEPNNDKIRNDSTNAWNTFSLSGSTYLAAGDKAPTFQWKLILQNTTPSPAFTGDLLGEQTVIWQYTGK